MTLVAGAGNQDDDLTDPDLDQTSPDYGAPAYPEPPIASPQFTATCKGSRDRNGFYGDGIVDAAAVDRGGRDRDDDEPRGNRTNVLRGRRETGALARLSPNRLGRR